MSINFSVRWADNTADLKRNLAQGLDQIEVTRAAVDKLARSLGGENQIKSANNWAAALHKLGGEAGALGGIQKLTTAEVERAIGVFDRAIAKSVAMGTAETALAQTYRDVSAALHKASDEADKSAVSHKTLGDSVQGLGVSFGKLVASQLTAQAIISTVEGGFRALVGVVSESVKAASEAEHAHVQVAAALKTQGNAIPSVVQAYLGYADALQRTTIFQDDAIEASEALLIQIGNVMPRDMQKALKATTELASGLGIDLQQATMLVAKAAEGNTTALRKAGVVLDETTAKSGDFGKVLDAITAKFDGQAAAIAGTYEGRLKQLGNTWNNVEESIGRVITQNATILKLFDDVNQRIATNTHELKDNSTASNAVSDAVILAVRGVALLASTLDVAQTGLAAFVLGARRGGQAIGNIGILALEAAKGIALMQGDLAGFHVPDAAIASLKQAVRELGERNLVTTEHSVGLGQALDTIGTKADELAADLARTRGQTVELDTATDKGTGAWDRHTKAVGGADEAQKKYAAALARYNSTDGSAYLDILDKIGNAMYEGIATDIARGKSAEDLVEIYHTTSTVIGQVVKAEDAYKKKLAEVSAAADHRRQIEIEINTIIKEQTLAVNKLVIAGLDARLKAQDAYNTEVARMTLSAVDFQKAEIEIQIKNQEALGSALVGDAKITSDLIVATLKLRLEQVDTLWKEHPMIPPKATFQTQAASIGSVFDSLGQTIQGLSTISQGTFGNIVKDIGLANVAAQALNKALGLTFPSTGDAEAKKTNVGASAGGAAGAAGALALASGPAAIITAWVAVGIAVYSFVSALREANAEAAKLKLLDTAMQGAAKAFQSGTNFSTTLGHALADTANDFYHITALNQQFGGSLQELRQQAQLAGISIYKIGTGKNGIAAVMLTVEELTTALGYNSTIVLQHLAQAANLSDIIKELGGVAALTADQMKMVHDRAADLFILINLGGPVGQKAIKTMDDTLIAFTADLSKSGGLVDQFFLDTAARAKAAGVTLKQVADFQAGQAKDAETGIVSALGITNDAWAKRKTLQDDVAQATTDLAGKSGSALADQQKKLADLNAQLLTQQQIIDATGVHSQAAAGAVSGALLGVISSQVAAGKSFGDAIREVAPGIASLKTQLDAMGIGGGSAFDFLNQQVGLFTGEVTGPALQSIEGYAQGLVGLHNAGQLNQDTFAGITEQIGKTEQALEAQGVSGPALLTAMQSPLQKIWELEEKFGYKADDATQALIDQALAAGEVGETQKSVADQMLDATTRIADAVEGLAEVFGVLPRAARDAASGISDELSRIRTPTITIPVGFRQGDEIGSDGLPKKKGEGFASGSGGIRDFGLGTNVTLHGREAVFTEDQLKQGATQTSAGSGGNTVVLQESFTFQVTLPPGGIANPDYVEKELMPQIIGQIEDHRRGYTARLKGALA